jgi:hypothetical protein
MVAEGWGRCGGEAFFECSEGHHKGRGGDDGVPELHAHGPLDIIEGCEAMLTFVLAPIACLSCRAFASTAHWVDSKVRACVAREDVIK